MISNEKWQGMGNAGGEGDRILEDWMIPWFLPLGSSHSEADCGQDEDIQHHGQITEHSSEETGQEKVRRVVVVVVFLKICPLTPTLCQALGQQLG